MSTTKSRDVLSFSHFLLRSKCLKLYRDILRTTKKIPNKDYQLEIQKFVRQDFDNNKHLRDEEIIKYHLHRGKLFHDELLSALSLSN